ncbi:MAG: 1-acyl-sn-glycerol-3-phosphate acyltransferase [Bacteroidales bacterium]|nr:1-acyl-sn-glycerol-3-phosphate acyltransferase [Bacteroidales bacterium]
MRKPYERDWRYSWARIWCDDAIRSMFNHISSEGKENVPSDGAVLLAPNHCNTVMDALVILQDWKDATLFGARADVFHKPFVRKILHFLRILPLPRARDGVKAVLDNRSTIEEVVDCLDHGMRYCMFCEGTHRAMHSLLPLKKGIIRTALAANERFGERKPVYIVPVGLEYQDYYRIKTPLTIRYGKAINVTEFVSSNLEMVESHIYKHLLDTLKERISSLITCLPDDETYEGRWALAKISDVKTAMAASEEKIKDAGIFDLRRRDEGLSSWSFKKGGTSLRIIGKTLAFILLLPLILFAAVAAAPMWLLSAYLAGKIKDKAFVRTARFGVKFAMMPILIIIWGLVYFLCLPLGLAVIAFLLSFWSHSIFYEAVERGRILISDIRLSLGHKELKESYSKCQIQEI